MTLAKILNKAFGMPYAEPGKAIPSVTAYRVAEGEYRILLRNPSHRYYLTALNLPFEIERAEVLNKSKNHSVQVHGSVLHELLDPCGTSIIAVKTK